MKNQSKEFKNKLLISSIKLLIPNLDKSYYLAIIVNENKTYKTKKLDFEKSNIVDVNQIFELDGISTIDTIKFQIYEKNTIFSNGLYKGEVNKSNKQRDELTNQLICFLSNNNQENCVVVYYNYEINADLLESFDLKLKNLEELQKSKSSPTNKSTFSSLRELASGDNAENFAKFVHNMEYLKTLSIYFEEFVYWKNPWKTIAILLIYSLTILYFKLFITILPLILIFFHLCNKDKLQQYSHKNTKHDNLHNMTIITKTIDLTNKTFYYYENFLEAMQYSEKKLFEEIYLNLLKLILFNGLILYFELFSFKIMMMIPVWGICLWSNPAFQAFLIFMKNFVYAKILSHFENHPKISQWKEYCEMLLFKIVPFSDLIRKYLRIRNEILTNMIEGKNSSTNKNVKFSDVFGSLNSEKTVILSNEFSPNDANPSAHNSTNDECLKFELYENERWWMFVGWAKNLIMNERPLWSDISGKNYMEKNTVFLPNSDYQWLGEWKIEGSENTDIEGWEYSKDFNSVFKIHSTGKYVRRRKWIRYAKKSAIK